MATRSHSDVQPVTDLVTEAEVFEAMQFRDETDREVGELQADHEYGNRMLNAAEAVVGLYSTERSADKRKWEAQTDTTYLQRLEALHQIGRRFFALKAQRESATIKIEVWRTIQANKRVRDDPGRR